MNSNDKGILISVLLIIVSGCIILDAPHQCSISLALDISYWGSAGAAIFFWFLKLKDELNEIDKQ